MLLRLTGVVLAFLTVGTESRATEAPQPNIIYFLADDMGWGDVGWHKGEILTPNLDKLAASGARLEQFYVQPVCSPTRAAFMTGRYPMRHWLQVGVVRPWAQYGLPLEERTIAQALREAGYQTAICGKWHLGHFEPEYLPTRRGFEQQYGHYNGAIGYFDHTRDGGFDWHKNDRVSRDEGYTTHLIAREAVKIVHNRNSKKPLFLYVPFNAVHAPHQVPEKYKEPYAHMREPRRTYAGMLAALDEAVGQIVAECDRNGMRANTLFLFSSDNGGPAPGRVTSNGPLRGQKGQLFEGGVRVPAVASWEGKIKAGSEIQTPIHIVDLYPTLLELAGAKLDQANPIDGIDAWPVIQGEPGPKDRVILHNATPDAGAVRVGDWKLIVGNGADDEPDALPKAQATKKVPKQNAQQVSYQLFDIAHDPYEKDDRSDAMPEKRDELYRIYRGLAEQAIPPKNKPKAPGFTSPQVWGEQ